MARAIRNAIRANRFARIICAIETPIFCSASGRFARITRISDSRESPDSRESCESIRANHATKSPSFPALSRKKGKLHKKYQILPYFTAIRVKRPFSEKLLEFLAFFLRASLGTASHDLSHAKPILGAAMSGSDSRKSLQATYSSFISAHTPPLPKLLHK